MKRNKKKGFTLVELIAVIAILAILAAVVVPKISSYSDSARLSAKKADAATLLNAIQVYNTQASTGSIDLSSATTIANIKDSTTLDTTNAKSAADDLVDIAKRIVAKNGDGTADGVGTSSVSSGKALGGLTQVKYLSGLLNATN